MPKGHKVNRAYEAAWHALQVATKKAAQFNPLPAIGRRLAEARAKAGITQLALAKMAGVGQTALSKFETGKRGLDAKGFARLLVAASEAGISVEQFVLRGTGSQVHATGVVAFAQDPAFQAAVLQLADELKQRSQLHGPCG